MKHFATITTPDGFAMQARKARLKRLCRANVRQHALELLQARIARTERPSVNIKAYFVPMLLCSLPLYYVSAASTFLSQF